MRLGVRSQKRTGIISILFAGILIWKYLTGNEHVKFYPWQDSQSPNISNICVKNSWCPIQEMILLKWNKPKARIWPYCIFSGRFPTSTFWKSHPGHFFGYVPRIWTQPQVGMSPYLKKLPILDILQALSLTSWYFCILKLGSRGPLGPRWCMRENPMKMNDLAVPFISFILGNLQIPCRKGIPATKRDPLDSRAWTVTCLVHTQPGSWEVGPWLKDLIWG